MKVSDAMTSQVSIARPTDSIRDVAQVMARVESGVVPVVDDGKVVGVVTDRDIVLRVVAEGRSFDSPISEAMSDGEVLSVREDDILADATAKMASNQVRRLVVLNDAGKLTGILSLGDVAKDYGAKQVGKTLEEISQEGGGDTAH
ncbi:MULTISPECIES: CBS domain-containing protein [unclassified Caulobacter]|jgi:CBS domain-containing protein|uniref:CBS domain-containing protein n=1 Tax=unclassified Caulobacter TaxID=2648921 RepID=UPI0006F4DBDA|nr:MULTISPECIES: CBS domain-containing protein [unclassified Caulobacter]KQV62076.1 signal transduction protein [Caulobacter sp. Root342]KQV64712.1 signal transduction protein [Caulobacter sp. Root343]